jgi:hypothetical protein
LNKGWRNKKAACRFVLTYINKDGMRQLFGAAQGRNTYATKEEAENRLKAVLTNNSEDTLKNYPKMEVRPCECWPIHFDPKGIYFEK